MEPECGKIFHEDPCTNTCARGVNTQAHVFSRMPASPERVCTDLHEKIFSSPSLNIIRVPTKGVFEKHFILAVIMRNIDNGKKRGNRENNDRHLLVPIHNT